MTTGPVDPPPVTMMSLAWHWGHAYGIGYGQDQWIAARHDRRTVLRADTLARLETAIIADHRDHPVPRDFEPPGAGDFLDLPAGEPGHGLDLPDEHTHPEEEASLNEDTLTILDHLRDTFPRWAISYSRTTRVWTARTRHATICQHSAALLAIALTLIERKQRQTGNGPRQDP